MRWGWPRRGGWRGSVHAMRRMLFLCGQAWQDKLHTRRVGPWVRGSHHTWDMVVPPVFTVSLLSSPPCTVPLPPTAGLECGDHCAQDCVSHPHLCPPPYDTLPDPQHVFPTPRVQGMAPPWHGGPSPARLQAWGPQHAARQ
jgi:hypothetical protein